MKRPEVFYLIMCCLYKYSILMFIGFFICLYYHNSSTAQSFHSDIELEFSPDSVIVNQDSNKIYVADIGSNRIAVIDGAINEVTNTINVIDTPSKMDINHLTNLIYVTHSNSKSISSV